MIAAAFDGTFDGWRKAARLALAAGVAPGDVRWACQNEALLPLGDAELASIAGPAALPRVPRAFVSIATAVACHRDQRRWDLLYRVLWRLTHGEPHLLEIAVDPDVYDLAMMEKAVRRDRHKMTAFVRFRRIVDADANEQFIAWHRPDHHIVRLAAPFFIERFAAMKWAILTPDESVWWDGRQATFGAGVPRSAAPQDDELEALWKTYYGSIFNPARVNLRMMRQEMPVRHWATLPETQIIGELLEAAPERVQTMVRRTQKAASGNDDARLVAAPAISLPQLAEKARSCTACDLHCHATQTVFGEGPADAKIVFVGEQPGDEEDRSGKPFVGPAGRLLNEILEEVGIDRSRIYVTNAVKHFKWEPRGTRRLHKTPTAREVVACQPWLERELSLIHPPAVVCLGATAARAVFGRDFQLTPSRGKPRAIDLAPWAMATWHPSALLRIPDADRRKTARAEFTHDLATAAKHLATL